MRKTNLFFALVSFLLCVCANAKKIESGSCGENVKYTLYDSGLLVIKGKGEMKNYNILVKSPWNSKNVKQVKIKNGVTSIGEYLFVGCSGLTSITIPNSVTSIGDGAFYDCSGLTSITIPNSVTSIGENAFPYCPGLASLSVESGNTKYDSRDSCNAIIETETNTLIAGCRNTVIPNSVTSIGDCAFKYCSGLTSITIPNSVTSIGEWAFEYCSGLTSITIPNSVTSIGDCAFKYCSGLTSITIPNSVTSIGENAFDGCSGLTSLSVESGNTKYDSRDNCNAIIETDTNTLIAGYRNTVIPNSVTSIGDYAFYGCSGLTSITIPNSVTSIGKNAFFGCSELTSLSVESGNTKYDSRDNCNAIIETETNTLIAGCRNTVIPNSVTSIVDEAFFDCSGLTSITIPNSVTSIGDDAFYGCSGLTSITIPNSVTSIGKHTFENCSGLTSITIPNSVTSIGEEAFSRCSGLTSITIPNSVTSIGKWAFRNCSNISTIYCYATTPPTADSYPFDRKNYDSAILYVPKGTKKDYASSKFWRNFQNIVEMEDGK